LMKIPAALVFDHLGCVRGGRDSVDSPGFQALLRILQKRDDCWVKISSWYNRSKAGRPDYAVFGTNWPHPNQYPPTVNPNDGDLIDAFCGWFPDEKVRNRILVANP